MMIVLAIFAGKLHLRDPSFPTAKMRGEDGLGLAELKLTYAVP